MIKQDAEFELRAAHGVRTVSCESRVWNEITVRNLVNRASPGRVWHDMSSTQMTVAVLLEQVGGVCETRFHVDRPLQRVRYHNGQITFIPAGTPIWGYSDGLRFTRGLRLFFEARVLQGLVEDDLDTAKTTSPLLMQYDLRISSCASLLADECRTPSFGKIYGDSLTLALVVALTRSNGPERAASCRVIWS